MIKNLQDKYEGQTAWIVGRGASLLNITSDHFGYGPVIVLNEAIINVAPLGLSNDVFTLWRNGDVMRDLPNYGAIMILCDDPVLNDPPSSTRFTGYNQRYTFDCRQDLNCNPAMTFSMKAALEIAVQIFGCTSIAFIAFDSCTTGDLRTVLKNGFIQSEHKPGAYNEQCQIIRDRIRELDIPATWITPMKIQEGPLRLNIGCGEVMEPGYINIDLHYPDADEHMDAQSMEYEDESVDEIYSSHLLEHFGKREVPEVLGEWFRILKPDGILKMDLPNLEWCMRNWLNKSEKDRFGIALDMIYGLQTHEGEFHKTGFTEERLFQLLAAAGFKEITVGDKESHAQMCFYVTARKDSK
jgi:predicted SAM-dependent methyltransferase